MTGKELQDWVQPLTQHHCRSEYLQILQVTVLIYQQIHCRKSVSSIWYRQKSLLIRICFNPSINFLPIGGTPAKAKIPLFSIFQSRHQELHSSKDCYHWEQLIWVVQWLLACFPRHSLGQNMTIWLKQSKSISQLTLSLPHHSNTHTCIFLCSPRYYPLQPLLLRLLQPRAATWPSFLLQCYMILPSMLRTLFKCIHFIPCTLEYFHSYMIFFLKPGRKSDFYFIFLPSALQGRFQQYKNTAGNWDSPSVPTLLQPTRGTGKMALTCLLEYQGVVWPSHLKVLCLSILWLFHSSGGCISYLKLLSRFHAHRSNRNQFLTSSSASPSRSIHFI